MNRWAAGALVVVTLAVGVAVGAGVASIIASSPSPTAPTAFVQPTPAPSTIQPTTEPSSSAPSPTTNQSPTPGATPSAPPTPTPAPTATLVPDPLDGVMVTQKVASRHVIAVMIDDLWAARPQSGLSQASIVWQAPAEGGIPRYMALFHEGNPPAVGPVRSSRLYFIAWASEWNSVYVHVGGSPQALALLHSAQGKGKVVYDADEFRWAPTYLWRIKTRSAPHNVYSDAAHLRRLAAAVKAPSMTYKANWKFAPEAPFEARPKGGRIVVPYLANVITYDYDRKTNRYLRSVSVEGKQVDAGTKQRIGPRNVVIMVVSFAPLNDGSKKHRLEAQFVGSGTAWISTNGKTVKGTWKKASMTAPTRLFGPGGKAVTLTVGQTFVQVVPVGTNVSIHDGKVPPPEPPAGYPRVAPAAA